MATLALLAATLILLLVIAGPSLSSQPTTAWPLELRYQTTGMVEARLSSPMKEAGGQVVGQDWNDWRNVVSHSYDGAQGGTCLEARPDGTLWSGSSLGDTEDPCDHLVFLGDFGERALPFPHFVIEAVQEVAHDGGPSWFTFKAHDRTSFAELPVDDLMVGHGSGPASCASLGIVCPNREQTGILSQEVIFESATGLVISFREEFDGQSIFSYEVTDVIRRSAS